MKSTKTSCVNLERFEKLEKSQEKTFEVLEAHLIQAAKESSDIEWIKKAVWVCATASLTSAGSFVVALIMYLLKK
jgi:hypothetical protein